MEPADNLMKLVRKLIESGWVVDKSMESGWTGEHLEPR